MPPRKSPVLPSIFAPTVTNVSIGWFKTSKGQLNLRGRRDISTLLDDEFTLVQIPEMPADQEVLFGLKCLFRCEELGCRLGTLIIQEVVFRSACFQDILAELGYGLDDTL